MFNFLSDFNRKLQVTSINVQEFTLKFVAAANYYHLLECVCTCVCACGCCSLFLLLICFPDSSLYFGFGAKIYQFGNNFHVASLKHFLLTGMHTYFLLTATALYLFVDGWWQQALVMVGATFLVYCAHSALNFIVSSCPAELCSISMAFSYSFIVFQFWFAFFAISILQFLQKAV